MPSGTEGTSPADLVAAFIADMNAWELLAKARERAAREEPEPWAFLAEVRAKVANTAVRWCTSEFATSLGDSYGSPPSDDPAAEHVRSTEAGRLRATVETEREAPFSAGRYRYELVLREGRWLIATKRYLIDGRWKNWTL
jgi:hypothetical protein